MAKVLLLTAAALLSWASPTHSASLYLDAPWVHNVTGEGQSVTLNCSIDKDAPDDALPVHWLLNTYDQALEDYNDGNVRVMSSGWQLHIRVVERPNLGYYYCLRQQLDKQNTWMVKFGVSPDHDYFHSEWSLFKWNTIIGCIAAAVFIGLIAFICLVYQCRWRGDEEHNQEKIPPAYNGTAAGLSEHGEVTVNNPVYQQSYSADNKAYLHSQPDNTYDNDLYKPHKVAGEDGVTCVTVNNTML